MANGRTHAAANAGLLTLVLVTGATGVYLTPHPTVVAVAAGAILGAVGGLVITPDIDHHEITHEERRLIRAAPPIGYLWTLFWLPYGIVFSHRGLSHTIPQGTLSRILYIGIPTAALLWAFDIRPDVQHLQRWLLGSVALFVTWMLQDLLHLMLDGLWPGRTPWRRPR